MSKRRCLIAANWKMHKTLNEARTLAREVHRGLTWGLKTEVALAPPFTSLAAVAEGLADSDIRLAAQDTLWERQGAYTWAISPLIKNVQGYLRKRNMCGAPPPVMRTVK
jgi:triosephosphate isomerase